MSEEEEHQEEKKELDAETEELIEARTQERLAHIKKSLDEMAKKAKAAEKEAAELKAKQKEAEREKLEREGKLLETTSKELEELRAELKVEREKTSRIARDRAIEQHTAGLPFRNDVARQTFHRQVMDELILEDDVWIHKSGISIKEFITTYSKSPDVEFFFKPKENQGTKPTLPTGKTQRPTSLKGLSSEQLLELAAKGALPQVGSGILGQ